MKIPAPSPTREGSIPESRKEISMPLFSVRAVLVPSLLLAFGASVSALGQSALAADFNPDTFKVPPAQYRGHAMGSINLTRDTPESLAAEVDEARKLNYGGLFFEPGGTTSLGLSPDYLKKFARGTPGTKGVEFLSPEYFKLYDAGVQQAQKDGLEVVLYDDYSFPSGTAGGLLYSKFPQYAAKSLSEAEQDVIGPKRIDLAIPEGIYMGAVLMNRDTHEVVDVSSSGKVGHLIAQVPKGNWKAMAFYLVEGRATVVDYLDPKAMTAYMSLTYDRYNQYLGKYFGNIITQTFYDEPSMHHADRMWTPDFNAAFQKKYGYSPMKYYPALWYDIGPQTAAARVALFGFRGELFHENFIKRLNDWCAAHHLQFGGHTRSGGAPQPHPAQWGPDQGVRVPDPPHGGRHLVVGTLERLLQNRHFGGLQLRPPDLPRRDLRRLPLAGRTRSRTQVAMDQYRHGDQFPGPGPHRPAQARRTERLRGPSQLPAPGTAAMWRMSPCSIPSTSLHAAYHHVGGQTVPAGRRRAGSANHGDRLRPRGRFRASRNRLPGRGRGALPRPRASITPTCTPRSWSIPVDHRQAEADSEQP
jgi:hypothetical protein